MKAGEWVLQVLSGCDCHEEYRLLLNYSRV